MNELHPQLIDTPIAIVERVSPQLIEVRFKPDVKLDVKGMAEVVQAKYALAGGSSPDVLVVTPPDLDFELSVLNLDHSKDHGSPCGTRRLAFAAQSEVNERLASIYFAYHPRQWDTSVFRTEEEARAWLLEGVSASLN